MTEEDSRKYDAKIKKYNLYISIIGFVGVILSIYFGFYGQTKAIQNQWKQEFYKERITQYLKATEAAARYATLKKYNGTKKELLEATREFKTLYWGPMGIVEDDAVEDAMIIFNRAMSKEDIPINKLEVLAIRLAHVCRNEARKEFLGKRVSNSPYGSNEKLLCTMKCLLGPENKEFCDDEKRIQDCIDESKKKLLSTPIPAIL